MRWIVDTSVWARRDVPAIRGQLAELLAEQGDNEFVLSPSVLLELMRGPQGQAVAEERAALAETMEVLSADERTFELAATAMESLARAGAEAHRLPIADLISSALAHQHGCGIVHVDGDFERISESGELHFEHRRFELHDDSAGGTAHSVAGRQRVLKEEVRPASPSSRRQGR